MSKKYEAMVLSCMDPRFQKPVHQHLKDKKLTGKFSAFTIAGGSIGVTNNKFKKGETKVTKKISEQIAFIIFFLIILGLIVYSINDLLF